MKIHYQSDVVLALTSDNLNEDGTPIIKIKDLIIFSERPKEHKGFIPYDLFFKWIDMYFEYVEMGTKEHRTIRITGFLTKFQDLNSN
ncbi:MAG: hypothetical protein ABI367_07950 [Mucilaginibacter sp.]